MTELQTHMSPVIYVTQHYIRIRWDVGSPNKITNGVFCNIDFTRHSSLSKFHTVSQHMNKCNLTYAHKKRKYGLPCANFHQTHRA
jgi:hypothetical protein